ncbi:hypothetical protein Pyn_10698 [Prunus yedoensis var. nudiflora]|uniref:Uncharacterized protein n=1 Tax=Prunus yedoensis var. nudiflora TaxID=2094558 RepID=A0A314XUC3_PRUYE|nr:hypothetical protein Pyn_10698 [Prunus yedoensis var. nudiflora]
MEVTLRITSPSAAAGLVPAAICLPQQSISSKGIWLRDNPLDYPFPLIMAQVTLVLFTSRTLYYLLRPLGQTKFVCNLLGGIILGPSLLGHKKSNLTKKHVEKDSKECLEDWSTWVSCSLSSIPRPCSSNRLHPSWSQRRNVLPLLFFLFLLFHLLPGHSSGLE